MTNDREPYDVAIIGGGIVGLATARALAHEPRLRLIVLEAEQRLAAHQTGNNSGVIHSGLYYKPGSLKATLCTTGRESLYRYCAERGIAHDRCGKVVVATDETQKASLDRLLERGEANGLKGLRRLGAEEIREYEPHVRGVAGLLVSDTGIVDFVAVVEAFADEVRAAGHDVRTGVRVRGVRHFTGGIALETSQGAVTCRNLINCGGLQSDRVARLCGVAPGLRIVPFRGEYYELTPPRRQLVRNLVYPVPDPRFPFLGVHFTRMVGGGVEAGPNAVLSFKREGYKRHSFSLRDSWDIATYGGFWSLIRCHWRMGMGEMVRSWWKPAFVRSLQTLIPEVTGADLVSGGAGVRAQAVTPDGALVDDFRIVQAERMVHVLNAPSPAATASMSIGAYIAARARETFAELTAE